VIPDEELDRVIDAADIVAVIGERVKLKRVGNSWRGPCPFHQGKGDNFSVMPNGGYRCWVCGETGSVFTFVQKQLGLDFVESVKYVGKKSGIDVREVTRRTEGPDPREPLWEVVATTAEYFRKMLWDDDEGSAAREYLAKRGITREVAERFGLGYSPRPIGAVRQYLDALGVPLARQVEAGILKQEEGKEPRPRFRGRLMFPIHDARGRAVGFGGRSLDGGEPKYINSPESAVYSKGALLYHLHEARHAIRKAERALLVEGYFDVVRTVASGIDEVVAPLGTALTTDQAKLLRRFTANVFLLYDSDTAGLKATFRSGDVLLRERAAVRVVTLPEGEDPDTFVEKFGAAGLEKSVKASIDIFERKLQLLHRGAWFSDLARSRRAVDRLLPSIRAAADPVTRDLYLTRAAQVSGVDRDTLAREAAAIPEPDARSVRPGSAHARGETAAERRSARPAVQPAGVQAERALVRAMLYAPERVEEIVEGLGRIDEEAGAGGVAIPTLRDPGLVAVYRAVLDAAPDIDPVRVSERLPAHAIPLFEALLAEQESVVNLDVTIADSLRRLGRRWRDERIDSLLAAPSSDRDQLNAEVLRLKKEIQALHNRASPGAAH
jgi:DNA primase